MRKIENVHDWFKFEDDAAKNVGTERGVSKGFFGLSLSADKIWDYIFTVVILHNDGPATLTSIHWLYGVPTEEKFDEKTSERFYEDLERHFGLPFYIADVCNYNWV